MLHLVGFVDDVLDSTSVFQIILIQGSYFELTDIFNCVSILPVPGTPAGNQSSPSDHCWASCRGSSLPERSICLTWQDKEALDFTGGEHSEGEQSGIWRICALEFSCLASLRSSNSLQAVREWKGQQCRMGQIHQLG